MLPRVSVDWYGSRSQLEDEGLIPAGFEWPSDRRPKQLAVPGFDVDVQRTRPPGRKGPMSNRWDYWRLSCRLADRAGMGHDAYVSAAGMKQEQWLQSPAGADMRRRHAVAMADIRFQRFKQVALAAYTNG